MGACQPTHSAIIEDDLGKLSLEFRAIVRKHTLKLEGVTRACDLPELGGMLGVLAR